MATGKITFSFFFASCFWLSVFAQAPTQTTIGILAFRATSSGHASKAEIIQEVVTSAFVNAKRFDIVERKRLQLIEKERELQKSEDFLDGYIVEQSKSVGAQVLLSGTYSGDSRLLDIKLFDVSDGKLKGALTISFTEQKKGLLEKMAALDSRYRMYQSATNNSKMLSDADRYLLFREVSKFMDEHFPPPLVQVVRAEDASGSKVKMLLIAGGTAKNIKKNDLLEVYFNETLEVEGEQMQRPVALGSGKVVKVENDNFSQLEVEEGNKEIKEKLDAGMKLFCKKISQ